MLVPHSFISYIYIAPLQVELLRDAPNTSAAEKSSFEMREGGRKGPGEETKGLGEGNSGRRAHYRRCLVEVQANGTRRPCSDERRDIICVTLCMYCVLVS